MEYIETYKGIDIYKDTETTFFKAGLLGGDIGNISFLKKLIDIKLKK